MLDELARWAKRSNRFAGRRSPVGASTLRQVVASARYAGGCNRTAAGWCKQHCRGSVRQGSQSVRARCAESVR